MSICFLIMKVPAQDTRAHNLNIYETLRTKKDQNQNQKPIKNVEIDKIPETKDQFFKNESTKTEQKNFRVLQEQVEQMRNRLNFIESSKIKNQNRLENVQKKTNQYINVRIFATENSKKLDEKKKKEEEGAKELKEQVSRFNLQTSKIINDKKEKLKNEKKIISEKVRKEKTEMKEKLKEIGEENKSKVKNCATKTHEIDEMSKSKARNCKTKLFEMNDENKLKGKNCVTKTPEMNAMSRSRVKNFTSKLFEINDENKLKVKDYITKTPEINETNSWKMKNQVLKTPEIDDEYRFRMKNFTTKASEMKSTTNLFRPEQTSNNSNLYNKFRNSSIRSFNTDVKLNTKSFNVYENKTSSKGINLEGLKHQFDELVKEEAKRIDELQMILNQKEKAENKLREVIGSKLI